MDYIEQLVARKPGARARVIQVMTAVVALLLILLLALIPGAILWVPLLFVGIVLLAVILIRRQNVEFEYSLNGDELVVDKIFAKSTL